MRYPDNESRPFFQYEYETESHGRKTILDRVVETDRSRFEVEISPQYLKEPPERIALLPFTDVGSAEFVVDKIPLTHRDATQRSNWAWTDAQRLRRSLQGYLAQREFIVALLASVDAVLRSRRIDRPEKLDRVSAAELGRLLEVDAVVYGSVLRYEAYYFGLVAGWEVACGYQNSFDPRRQAVGPSDRRALRHSDSPCPRASGHNLSTPARTSCSCATLSWRAPKMRPAARSSIEFRSPRHLNGGWRKQPHGTPRKQNLR